MTSIKLSIKNMVCPRCIIAVETALTKLDIEFTTVNLGEVLLVEALSDEEKSILAEKLESIGFELLSDSKAQIIERIKTTIIEMVHYQDQPEKIGHLIEQLPYLTGHGYSTLSKLFSDVEGITIEKYLILQKIERAKELILYKELNLSEIAYQLNYSSSQHFSRQFKAITGLSPSSFQNKKVKRKSLTKLY